MFMLTAPVEEYQSSTGISEVRVVRVVVVRGVTTLAGYPGVMVAGVVSWVVVVVETGTTSGVSQDTSDSERDNMAAAAERRRISVFFIAPYLRTALYGRVY